MKSPRLLDTLAATSALELARVPFPASRKRYLAGSRDDLRVPTRDVQLSNGETISLYDTSGPCSDPEAKIDVTAGLPSARATGIESRGDTEAYAGRLHQPLDDGLRRLDADTPWRAAAQDLQRTPRRAKSGANVTQMHYAGCGIVTPEMEYVALRENGRRESAIRPSPRASRRKSRNSSGRSAGVPTT